MFVCLFVSSFLPLFAMQYSFLTRVAIHDFVYFFLSFAVGDMHGVSVCLFILSLFLLLIYFFFKFSTSQARPVFAL